MFDRGWLIQIFNHIQILFQNLDVVEDLIYSAEDIGIRIEEFEDQYLYTLNISKDSYLSMSMLHIEKYTTFFYR